MSPEDIMTLQKIIKTSDDGVFWPGTFKSFIEFRTKVWEEFSLQSLVDTWNFFNSMTRQERKDFQPEWWKDWDFGPNTFKYMISQNTIIWKSVAWDEQVPVNQEETPVVEIETQEEITPIENDESFTMTTSLWDHHPEVFVPEENIEVLTDDEKIEKFISEAESIHSVLIEFLQAAVSTGVDGDFGPNSARAVITKYPDAQSLESVMQLEWIPMSWDGVLPIRKNTPESKREVFREIYGEYVDTLEANLNLPTWLIESIIRQETKHGTYGGLMSPSWCKGMMQLSAISITDMQMEHRGGSRYRELFQNLDLDTLLSIDIWEWKAISKTIPSPIIISLRKLQNPDTSNSVFSQEIRNLRSFIKGDNTYFNHAVNMILWSVYLAGTYHDNSLIHGGRQDVTATADLYNAAAWERVVYRKNVTNYFNEYHQE
jgi:hypothetical protein